MAKARPSYRLPDLRRRVAALAGPLRRLRRVEHAARRRPAPPARSRCAASRGRAIKLAPLAGSSAEAAAHA